MNYNEDFKHLRNSLNNNTLTIFVGSGISKNSGCIEWWQIIEAFAEELKIKDKEPYYKRSYNEKGEVIFRLDEAFEKMIKIPQFYFIKFGEVKYYDLLQRLFNETYVPSKIHKFLINLRPKNFITTNYDTLIEDTAKEFIEAYDVISFDSDIKPMNNDRLIIKMHGDLTNRNLVLKENDYLNYSKNFKLTETLVKGILATNVTLFIGYSLSDYNVKQIIADIPHDENSNPKAYFIYLDDTNELEKKYYSKKGIEVLFVNDFLKNNGKLGEDKGENLLSFLNFIFKESLNESLIDDAIEILEPYRNFYLGKNGLQSLLDGFDVKKSNENYYLYLMPRQENKKTLSLFSELQDKLNQNKLEPYLIFNNIKGINFLYDEIPVNNSDTYNFKFIHEYNTDILLENALQFYYLGNYSKAYEIFSNMFKKSKLEKNYIIITISAYNIRKMNYFSDLTMVYEPIYEIPTDELDFILENMPKSYNYLNKLYSHEVVFKYTNDIFHATLKIHKNSVKNDINFLNMTLISFINFITINKITLDERLSDVNDIIYFAILKILLSDDEVLLEDYHIYLIYIFFNNNLLGNLKDEYLSTIKLRNTTIFIDKLMKDWDYLVTSPISYTRFNNSLTLITLLKLDYKHLDIIKDKILSLNSPVTLKLERDINHLLNYIESKKPAN